MKAAVLGSGNGALAVAAMDAVLKLVSIVMDRDYKAEKARTMEKLRLFDYSLEELKALL